RLSRRSYRSLESRCWSAVPPSWSPGAWRRGAPEPPLQEVAPCVAGADGFHLALLRRNQVPPLLLGQGLRSVSPSGAVLSRRAVASWYNERVGSRVCQPDTRADLMRAQREFSDRAAGHVGRVQRGPSLHERVWFPI